MGVFGCRTGSRKPENPISGLHRSILVHVTVLVLIVAIVGGTDHSQAPPKEAQPETFTWAMVGESRDWVVILHGYARREHGRVTYAHAQPWVIWAGGGAPPRRFSVGFSVDDIRCIHGTVGFVGPPGSKLSLVAPCKLVYPQSPSVPGDKPQDPIEAVRKSGRFVLMWNDQQETIHWGRAFPEGIYPLP
jgi:hypothetical protein